MLKIKITNTQSQETVELAHDHALRILNRSDNNGRWIVSDGQKWELKDKELVLIKSKKRESSESESAQ